MTRQNDELEDYISELNPPRLIEPNQQLVALFLAQLVAAGYPIDPETIDDASKDDIDTNEHKFAGDWCFSGFAYVGPEDPTPSEEEVKARAAEAFEAYRKTWPLSGPGPWGASR